MKERIYLAVDVGGTTVKSAVVDVHGRFVSQIQKTPIDPTADREVLIAFFLELLEGQLSAAQSMYGRVDGIGIAFPGPFDYVRGIPKLRGLGKYDSLYGLPLGDILQARIGETPVRFINDADAYTLGEGRFGVGARYGRVMCVCIGTGLGSGFLVDGMPVKSGATVPPNGWIYNTLINGEPADAVVSATGLRRMMRRSPALCALPDVKELADLARDGHAEALEIFRSFGERLAAVVVPHAVRFRADALILGGEVSRSADLFDRQLFAQLRENAIELLRSIRFGDNALSAIPLLFKEENENAVI